jgi:hypothetical protein
MYSSYHPMEGILQFPTPNEIGQETWGIGMYHLRNQEELLQEVEGAFLR